MKRDNLKFILGLASGLVIGLSVAGLQPLKAADQEGGDSLNLLLKEETALKKQGEAITKNTDALVKEVKGMSGNLEKLSGRSDIAPVKKPNY